MITRSGRWFRWDEADVIGVAAILGDQAAKGHTAVQDSFLKAAVKRGLLLTPELDRALRAAKRERIRIKRLKHLDDYPAAELPYPLDLSQKLFAHQRVALACMNGGRTSFLLGDAPGVGKTAVAILWAGRGRPRRVLVVVPNSAKEQWVREIHRWHRDARTRIVRGTIGEQINTLSRDGWIVTHWESLVHAAEGVLKKPWDVAIMDEAQWMRNRNASRSETAFELTAHHRLALTGHPFTNDPSELFSVLRFLHPEIYTSYWRFFAMHVAAEPKPFGGFQVLGARDPKLLRWELAPFTIRRTKRRVWKSLPSITRVPRYVDLPPKQRGEYEKLKREMFVELEAHRGEKRILAIPSVLARVTRLRQYVIDPGLLKAKAPSVKYPIVAELLEELDGPPVIFTNFRQAALGLGAHLTKLKKRVGYVTGHRGKENARDIKRFHAGQLDALITVTQAGGESLNFGRYGYVIFLDLPLTPMALEQAEGRVDRPIEGSGKMVPTTAFRIIVHGTYEERLEARLEEKRGMFREVFTVDDLVRLFE